MNAEEAGLALNVVELVMIGGVAYFVYTKLTDDGSDDQEAPQFIQMINDFKNWGSTDMPRYVNKWGASLGAAQQFIDDNAINNSQTRSATEAIGAWLAGGLVGAGKELFSSVNGTWDPTKDDWKSNESVAMQIYNIVKGNLQNIIGLVNQYRQTSSQLNLEGAENAIFLLQANRWSAGYAPPFYSSSDIASAVNTWQLDTNNEANLVDYASRVTNALQNRKPSGYAKVDDQIGAIYTLCVNYVTGWTPARGQDWSSWEGLEGYTYLTQLAKVQASQDVVETVMQNVALLTNKIYGAATYADGVQDALDKYTAHAKEMIAASALPTNQSPTCMYDYDVIMALFNSWGVSKKILPDEKKEDWATAIMTFQNETYAARWNLPPKKYESSLQRLFKPPK